MKRFAICASLLFIAMCACLWAQSQTTNSTMQKSSVVPNFVKFSGTAEDPNGKPLTGVAGITFSLYQEETGGAALWMETQNVHPDAAGHYNVSLGAEKPLPVELFRSGEARWLGTQVAGQTEQPRVLLLSVPYALKAADAETLDGKPASAFLQAQGNQTDGGAGVQPPKLPPGVHGNGTVNYIPLWTAKNIIDQSALFQSGTNVGIGTTTPSALLDINGTSSIRNTLTLFPNGSAPALSLSGTAFSVNNKGIVSWAPGQTFPGQGGSGTVTSVGLSAPSSDFTVSGSPVTSSGTLSFAWTQSPTASNVANAIVKRSGAGEVAATTVDATTVNATGSINSTGTVAGASATFSGSTGNGIADVAMSNAGDGFALYSSSSGEYNIYATGGRVGVTANGQTFPLIGATDIGYEGIYGANTNAVDGSTGIYGAELATSGTVYGVIGNNHGSLFGAGVYGQISLNNQSDQGRNWSGYGAGVWGDGGFSGNFGVFGTADDHEAGVFLNSSAGHFTLYASNADSSGYPFGAFNEFSKGCLIDPSGDLGCTGSKNAVVPIEEGRRKVALAAIESPKNWFEDFGSAHLLKGVAVVDLEAEFAQTVNTGVEYHVFLTPNDDCKGLYVGSKTATSFEVRELGGGTSSARFDYRIVALRKDYENIRMADHTHDPGPMKMPARKEPLRLDLQRMIPPMVAPWAGAPRAQKMGGNENRVSPIGSDPRHH